MEWVEGTLTAGNVKKKPSIEIFGSFKTCTVQTILIFLIYRNIIFCLISSYGIITCEKKMCEIIFFSHFDEMTSEMFQLIPKINLVQLVRQSLNFYTTIFLIIFRNFSIFSKKKLEQ